MRYFLGILFTLLFVGFVYCTVKLGSPPSLQSVPPVIYLGVAVVCSIFSAVVLVVLAFGIGAKGRKISTWRVPLLSTLAFLVSFIFAALIFRLPSNGSLFICGLLMMLFMLVSVGSVVVSIKFRKSHNSKLALSK